MDELFGSMYCWLEDFFGIELANYLWGGYSPKQDGNMFIGIGLCMLGISFIVAIVFYYVVNHPRLNNWRGWLIFLGANAIINFIVGWQRVQWDFDDGMMIKTIVSTGASEKLNIYESDILAFGVTNMIVATIAFVVISYMVKWWSTNCSHAPF